jgi:hypothetical protein
MGNETKEAFSARDVPWQIWAIVVLLALEGISNYQIISTQPIAVVWLAAKVVFIIGLLRKWKWLYVIFLAVTGLHVVIFAGSNKPIISLLNLALIVLALWAYRYYFPKEIEKTDNGIS